MNELLKLRQALGKAVDEMAALSSKGGPEYDAKKTEVAEIRGKIARAEEVQAEQARLATPSRGGAGAENGLESANGAIPGLEQLDFVARQKAIVKWFDLHRDPKKHFASLGEQLQAIARHYSGGPADGRLVRAPIGAGETDPSAGGFLVQLDFVATILTRAYEMGQILSRATKLQIGGPFNGTKIPAIDETSRATGSRWGGVQSYWVGEGDTAAATKPKFRLLELDLKKLMSIWYVSDEMLQDSALLTGIANQAFSEEVVFMTEDAVFEGTGAGQPLGILNSPAKIAVAAEKGQATKTVIWPNIAAMWARIWARSRPNAIWLINQDIEPQLYQMNQAAGTGGVPVFLPSGPLGSQASGQPYGTLLGRPIIPVEYCSTLGTEGDITLADFSQYILADKNGMNMMSSIHVRFLTDEMTFRLTYRVDGEPVWNKALTPFKGSNTLSPYVTLAAR